MGRHDCLVHLAIWLVAVPRPPLQRWGCAHLRMPWLLPPSLGSQSSLPPEMPLFPTYPPVLYTSGHKLAVCWMLFMACTMFYIYLKLTYQHLQIRRFHIYTCGYSFSGNKTTVKGYGSATLQPQLEGAPELQFAVASTRLVSRGSARAFPCWAVSTVSSPLI